MAKKRKKAAPKKPAKKKKKSKNFPPGYRILVGSGGFRGARKK